MEEEMFLKCLKMGIEIVFVMEWFLEIEVLNKEGKGLRVGIDVVIEIGV